MDMNAVITGVVGVVAGVGGGIAHTKRLEVKVLSVLHGVAQLIESFKEKHETKVAVSDAQAALKAETTNERDALFKAAGYSFLQALQVNVIDLNDIQKATLAQYIADFVPKYKAGITPTRIDATLKLIQQEQEAAKAHCGLQAVQAIMSWMAAANQAAQTSETTPVAAPAAQPTEQTQQTSA